MDSTPLGPKFLTQSQIHLMNTASSFKPRFCHLNLKTLCTFVPSPKKTRADVRVRVSELKEGWLDSLSCPFGQQELTHYGSSSSTKEREENGFGKWVIGIDPDVHGALALLKDNDYGVSAQVFDTPHLPVLVGKRVRKRLDARSIVQLLHSFGAPLGTIAYIEQSSPFPQDGKQGWWSGGFTYGLWIGILVSSGFSVVPVPSRLWKDQFELYRNSSTKDDSRKAASDLFPCLSSSLKRKKDHGRADALLIAAYGKSIQMQSKAIATSSEALSPALSLEDSSVSNSEEPINIEALL